MSDSLCTPEQDVVYVDMFCRVKFKHSGVFRTLLLMCAGGCLDLGRNAMLILCVNICLECHT